MNTHERAKDALRALAAEIHDDDRPPERKESRRSMHASRKTLALAGQIRETLDAALRLKLSDPGLSGLSVDEVSITPEGVAEVRVTVPIGVDPVAARASLARATPRLRAELSRVVARKRLPTLAFVMVAERGPSLEELA